MVSVWLVGDTTFQLGKESLVVSHGSIAGVTRELVLLEGGDRLRDQVDGFLGLAQGPMEKCSKVSKASGFFGCGTHLVEYRDGIPQHRRCLIELPLLEVDVGDVVEDGGLAGFVAHLAHEGKRLPVVSERLRLVPQGGVHVSNIEQHRGGQDTHDIGLRSEAGPQHTVGEVILNVGMVGQNRGQGTLANAGQPVEGQAWAGTGTQLIYQLLHERIATGEVAGW